MSNRPHLASNLGPVLLHPDRVPREHQHREQQDGGVQDLLTDTFESGGDRFGARRNEERAEDPRAHASAHPLAAASNAPGGGQHDSEHEGGLEHFTEDDYG